MSVAENPWLSQGRMIREMGELLALVNQAEINGNQAWRTCMTTKMAIVDTQADARYNSALAQSHSQTISGSFGLGNGVIGIGGAVLGGAASIGELRDLNKIGVQRDAGIARVEPADAPAQQVNPAAREDRYRGMSNGAIETEKAKVTADYKLMHDISGLCTQILPTAFKGAAELSQAPLTAYAGKEDANSQRAQALSETTSNVMGNTEATVQSMQQFFGQVANLPNQALQWAVALSQAH